MTQQGRGGVARGNAAPGGALPSDNRDQMAAWSEAFLLPLVRTIERQADELKAMARKNGRLTERLEALTASHGPGASNLSGLPPDPMLPSFSGSWRALAPYLAPWIGAVLVLVTVVVLLAWGNLATAPGTHVCTIAVTLLAPGHS